MRPNRPSAFNLWQTDVNQAPVLRLRLIRKILKSLLLSQKIAPAADFASQIAAACPINNATACEESCQTDILLPLLCYLGKRNHSCEGECVSAGRQM